MLGSDVSKWVALSGADIAMALGSEPLFLNTNLSPVVEATTAYPQIFYYDFRNFQFAFSFSQNLEWKPKSRNSYFSLFEKHSFY